MRRATLYRYLLLQAVVLLLSALLGATATPAAAQQRVGAQGGLANKVVVPGHPPLSYRAKPVVIPPGRTRAGINIIAGVPAFVWSYGCSPTSAAMLMGYYDNTGYPNMYTGPTNGGVCPLTNDVWGATGAILPATAECPLSASHKGVDGRTTFGHVDDYWVGYQSTAPDPYITGGWAQHTPPDCLGDFMGSNQSYYDNIDGSTNFFFMPDNSPTVDYTDGVPTDLDGCHGMRLFVQSCGYTVTTNYNQYIAGYNGVAAGFTFSQYTAEIDAGHPVLIQVVGHTMIGYGYNTTGNLVYLHDTWDESQHQMTWGGTYFDGTNNLQHFAVTVLDLTPSTTAPTITTFTPSSGGSGTLVTITGTNLTGATAVTIGGTAATITTDTAKTLTVTVGAGATGTISVTTPGGTAISGGTFTFTNPQYHPADTNQDGRISINELTAYGKAWKLGTAWPVAPSPIPASYVTQAGTIWLHGEIYQYNAVNPAPLCWVAGQMAATAGAARGPQTAASGSAVAGITPQRVAGRTSYLLTLSVTPPAGCANYAVEETIPPGWTVVNCDHQGVVNAPAGTLRWGPFFAAQPRRLSYTLAPRGATPSACALSGVLSVDGANMPITGARQLP